MNIFSKFHFYRLLVIGLATLLFAFIFILTIINNDNYNTQDKLNDRLTKEILYAYFLDDCKNNPNLSATRIIEAACISNTNYLEERIIPSHIKQKCSNGLDLYGNHIYLVHIVTPNRRYRYALSLGKNKRSDTVLNFTNDNMHTINDGDIIFNIGDDIVVGTPNE